MIGHPRQNPRPNVLHHEIKIARDSEISEYGGLEPNEGEQSSREV